MKKTFVAALLLLASVAAGVQAANPVEEVRQAEIAFARAFADRDQARFFSFVADDAAFSSALRTLAGKKAVVERWSRFFATPAAPFSWGPERVIVNAAGTIGLSTGPVFDGEGNISGNFSSIWTKQPDGSWKVLFDGPGSPPACLADGAAPFTEGFVKADDGVRLHYRKLGEGPVTVIVPLEFIMFDEVRQFADIATVITYDLRNRGRSDRADLATVSIQQDVKDLEAVRRELKVDKFVPAGFSYLGLMVAMYTVQHPEHVTRVIQLGPVQMDAATKFPAALNHGREDAGIPAADAARWQELRDSAGVPPQRELCELQSRVFSYILVGNPAHANRIKPACDLENEWPANLDADFKSIFTSINSLGVTREQFAKISIPVLTIHGTKDRNAPYGSGREWAMTLPDARLVTVEGAGHVSWADEPAAVSAAIREFLRGNWPLGAEKITRLE
jgi:pimeloyl-ACP methyl ester carboxylesterase/ketosteroid isomerase-like protein